MVPSCSEKTSTFEVWTIATGAKSGEPFVDFTPGEGVRMAVPATATGLGEISATASGLFEMTLSSTPFGPLSFEMPPFLMGLYRNILAIGFAEGGVVVQAGLESVPARESLSAKLVTERIRVDDGPLIENACARLPAEARAISREDWLRDLLGEPYRPTCE